MRAVIENACNMSDTQDNWWSKHLLLLNATKEAQYGLVWVPKNP
jgi:hypothetical protein